MVHISGRDLRLLQKRQHMSYRPCPFIKKIYCWFYMEPQRSSMIILIGLCLCRR